MACVPARKRKIISTSILSRDVRCWCCGWQIQPQSANTHPVASRRQDYIAQPPPQSDLSKWTKIENYSRLILGNFHTILPLAQVHFDFDNSCQVHWFCCFDQKIQKRRMSNFYCMMKVVCLCGRGREVNITSRQMFVFPPFGQIWRWTERMMIAMEMSFFIFRCLLLGTS